MVSRDEYHAMLAARMSEEALDLKVRGLFNALGLADFTLHPPDGVGRYRAGYPDWTIAGRWVMWRELKTMKGKLSAAQQAWLERLKDANADVDVWRPIDYYNGRIAAELKAVTEGLRPIPISGRKPSGRKATTPRGALARGRQVRRSA